MNFSVTLNMRRILIALLALVAFCSTSCSSKKAEAASGPESDNSGAGSCQISLVDDKHYVDFTVNERALLQPLEHSRYKRVYFAMGCFWGSEAMMGGANGVVLTRVGFAGGTLPDPTYSAIGDHVETVEVLYDPEVTDLSSLLSHFWKNHNARAKPIFRQYASAIFCIDEQEVQLAKEQRKKWQTSGGQEKILTAVIPLKEFYPAGEGHQKYYLQQDPKLFQSLPSSEQKLNTLLATKLNAVSGRGGERSTLESTLLDMGIGKEAQAVLFQRAVWSD